MYMRCAAYNAILHHRQQQQQHQLSASTIPIACTRLVAVYLWQIHNNELFVYEVAAKFNELLLYNMQGDGKGERGESGGGGGEGKRIAYNSYNNSSN